MGAEPGRKFLKQPAAKLEPVIVVFDKRRHIPGFWSYGSKNMAQTKFLVKSTIKQKVYLAILAKWHKLPADWSRELFKFSKFE